MLFWPITAFLKVRINNALASTTGGVALFYFLLAAGGGGGGALARVSTPSVQACEERWVLRMVPRGAIFYSVILI